MEFEKIEKLVRLMSSSNLTEFELEEGEEKIKLKKEKETSNLQTNFETQVQQNIEVCELKASETVDSSTCNTTKREDIPADFVITAPLVGTFYCAEAEGAEPFVSVGDVIKKGQVVGIIEAMKLMNEIESEYEGEVVAVLVDNEQVVEYGQPLFRIAKR